MTAAVCGVHGTTLPHPIGDPNPTSCAGPRDVEVRVIRETIGRAGAIVVP